MPDDCKRHRDPDDQPYVKRVRTYRRRMPAKRRKSAAPKRRRRRYDRSYTPQPGAPFGVARTRGGGLAVRGSDQNVAKYGPNYRDATHNQRLQRRADRFYGLGDYRDYAKYVPRGIGALYGGYTGGLAGAAKGWNTGAQVSKFVGWGDYQGGEPSSYGATVDNQLLPGGNAPITVNSDPSNKTGDLYFTHTEFIKNITSPGTEFDIASFPINPGLKESFPFLSQLARNFTMYELQGLIFEYRPTSGEFGSSNNALGKVIMATNYDPDDHEFLNSVNMENYDYATSCKPSVGMRHGVETAPNQMATKMQFVRTGETTRDKIFTDLGLFQIATEGIPNAGTIGELWVTYNIKLSRAQIALDNSQHLFHYSTSHGNAYRYVTGVTGDRTTHADTITLRFERSSPSVDWDDIIEWDPATPGTTWLITIDMLTITPDPVMWGQLSLDPLRNLEAEHVYQLGTEAQGSGTQTENLNPSTPFSLKKVFVQTSAVSPRNRVQVTKGELWPENSPAAFRGITVIVERLGD